MAHVGWSNIQFTYAITYP